MKKKVITAFILFLLASFTQAFSQTQEMPGISKSELSSCEITRDDYFNGKSLWGYIDGGADVYLEYGFSRLHLQEVRFKNSRIKLEIYQMKDPQAAFGIFSISRFKCSSMDSALSFSCISDYQAQASLGSYYISAINENGTKEEKAFCTRLLQIVAGKIKGDSIQIPALFLREAFQPYTKELKFFNGKLGLQNGFPAWSDQFESYKNFSMYILPLETSKGYAYTAKISFSSPQDMKDFHEKAGFKNPSNALLSVSANGTLKALRQTGPAELVYFETNMPESEAQKFLKEID